MMAWEWQQEMIDQLENGTYDVVSVSDQSINNTQVKYLLLF